MKGCRPLNDNEIARVIDSFDGNYAARDKALFLLGVKSGFRISEILSLRIGDVVQAGKIVDRLSVARRHMKKKIEGRAVLLHPEAKEALSRCISELKICDPHSPVFLSRKGRNRPISRLQAWRVLKKAYAASNLIGKVACHSMRKTFADRVYDRLERDLVKTQRALGHKNINSTVQYLSFREEEIDEAILAI